jgi:hypothetical protein
LTCTCFPEIEIGPTKKKKKGGLAAAMAAEDEEREALEAIYGADLTVESTAPLRVKLRIALDVAPQAPVSAELTFACPADGTYPATRGPHIDARLTRAVGFIQTALYAVLADEAQRNLGGPMIFALAAKAKEWLEDELTGKHKSATATTAAVPSPLTPSQSIAARVAAASCDLENEGPSAKRSGTPVTKESYAAWFAGFLERKRAEKQRADLLAMQ